MILVVIALSIFIDEYEYQRDLSIEYIRKINKVLYFGKLDEKGNFVPSRDFAPIDLTVVNPKSFSRELRPLMMAFSEKDNVYEYRSKRLIPGIIYKGEFVPDIGGKVIDFDRYRFSKTASRIYNLPGRFVPKTKTDNNESPVNNVPEKPSSTKAPVERKQAPVRQLHGYEEHVFNLTLNVEYSRRFGNYLYFGTLDEYGNFKPSITESPIDVSKGEPKSVEKYIPLMSHIKQKEVYEFRFRTLIPGVIENGEFLPDLDGKIIDFADYQYSKTAKPIYNLPGKFVLVPRK